MCEKKEYEYAIIRFVPQVERGEFVNVGAILYCRAKRFLAMKYHLDEKRIKSFFDLEDLSELMGYLEAWNKICQGDKQGGVIAGFDLAERFRWLTATRSTTIQSSKVHPGLCEDPQKVLEDLFVKYVFLGQGI